MNLIPRNRYHQQFPKQPLQKQQISENDKKGQNQKRQRDRNQQNIFPLQEHKKNGVCYQKRKNFKQVFMQKKMNQGTQTNNSLQNNYLSFISQKQSPFTKYIQDGNYKQFNQKQNIENQIFINKFYKTQQNKILFNSTKQTIQSIKIQLIKQQKLIALNQQVKINQQLKNYQNYNKQLKNTKLQLQNQQILLNKLNDQINTLFQQKIHCQQHTNIINNYSSLCQKQKDNNQNYSSLQKIQIQTQKYHNYQSLQQIQSQDQNNNQSSLQTTQPLNHNQNCQTNNFGQSFADFQRKRQMFLQKQKKQRKSMTRGNKNKKSVINIKIGKSQKTNNNSQQKRHQNVRVRMKTSLQKSVSKEKKRNPNSRDYSNYDTLSSFHHKKKSTQNKQNTKIIESSLSFSTNKIDESIQNNISDSDANIVQKLDMTSVQKKKIVDHLERQLHQNQFGPYQNQLLNLLELIKEYSNPWSLLVIGQKILDDRSHYIQQLLSKQQQLKKHRQSIQKQKKRYKKENTIIDNQYKILNMIRVLGQHLSINYKYHQK